MNREDKNKIIEELQVKLENKSHFYLTDISELDAADTSNLRRQCFEKEIELIVVKNTLLKKAMEKFNSKYEELYEVLEGPTSIMFTEQGSIPGKLIKEFRKKHEKPLIKAAYVEEAFYIGDDQLETLASIKSKEELIGHVIALLQSPAKNVISALQSGANNLAGIVKTLAEREE